ncbi:hypothetical protein LUZ60_005719 [Juncus effusus]|nr:hypothetical protein LUZ60_005719 [Juncus effusus]
MTHNFSLIPVLLSPPPPPPLPHVITDPVKSFIILFCVIVLPCFIICLLLILCFKRRMTNPQNTINPTENEGRESRRQHGLDKSTIEMFPVLEKKDVLRERMKENLECVICLSEFGEDEILRKIPNCHHVFHADCIDTWFESKVTCPVCRVNLKRFDDVEAMGP